MTQEKLSRKLNITRSLISKYEHSTNVILTFNLKEYSKYFEVSSDYLVGKIDTLIELKPMVKS